MIKMNKYIILFAFSIILNYAEGNEGRLCWVNTTLKNDLKRDSIKNYNEYLFFGITFDLSKNSWSIVYNMDELPAHIFKKGNSSKNGLSCMFYRTMYPTGSMNKPEIEVVFNSDSSTIKILYNNINIQFDKIGNINNLGYNFYHLYYTQFILPGTYTYNNDTLLITQSDSLIFKLDKHYKYNVKNSNILYAISNNEFKNGNMDLLITIEISPSDKKFIFHKQMGSKKILIEDDIITPKAWIYR